MLNRVILIGRLVADPDVSATSSGIMRARFRLAVNRNYRNQQGEYDTDFINVTAWRKLGENVGQYTKKGQMIAVDGRLQVRDYETPSGESRRIYEVVAEDVRFLDRGGDRSSQGAPPRGADEPDLDSSVPEDDSLPF